MSGICEAFYEAVETVGTLIGQKPLPKGINHIEAGDWKLTLNSSGEERELDGGNIPPWYVLAEHKEYFVIALFGPYGGNIGGGMPEDVFIQQMRDLRASS